MNKQSPGIEATNITKSWEDNKTPPVFESINLSISPGEFVGIYGPNGSGKTTLLYVLSKLEQASKGTVNYTNSSKYQSAFVFQDYKGSLYNWLSVLENIVFQKSFIEKESKSSLIQDTKKLLSEYKLTSIEPLLLKYPYDISGGECQLVALARALFAKPAVLFLDEPFSALDVKNRRLLLAALQQMWNTYKPTVLLVSHEIDDVLLTAQRVLAVGDNPMKVIGEWSLPWPLPRDQSLIVTDEFVRIQKEIKLKVFLGDKK